MCANVFVCVCVCLCMCVCVCVCVCVCMKGPTGVIYVNQNEKPYAVNHDNDNDSDIYSDKQLLEKQLTRLEELERREKAIRRMKSQASILFKLEELRDVLRGYGARFRVSDPSQLS